jgi:hypothetical protein
MLQAKNETNTVVRLPGNVQKVPGVLLGEAPKRRIVQRPRRQPRHDPVAAVMAMVELRDHMRGGPALRAQQAARLEARQDIRTKLAAFVLFWLLAGLMVGMMWAGTHG